ncbi:MAG: hypothetical protein CME60_00445 [Halobacteriovoraceae bacterium]|nr:hypothetical protein [Halobacteriovoraceae bacterium]
MISKALVAVTVLSFSQLTFAGPFWNQLIKSSGYNPDNHAFCYTDSEGGISGENIHKKSYLASITKLVTSYAAVKSLGAAFKLTTKLYYNPETKELHISGGKDPNYSKRKLFYLVNQLNNAGIEEVSKITFDDQFTAWAHSENTGVAQRRPHEQSRSDVAKTLKAYLHTPEWELNKKAYAAFIGSSSRDWLDFLRMERNPENLNLKIGQVEYSEKAPFDVKSNGVRSFNVLSPRIEDYLKYTNILSHNYFADELFRTVGKNEVQRILSEFMNQNFPNYKETRVGFKDSEPTIMIHNGSGYPLSSPRRDNYATCAIIVKMIEEMDQELITAGEEIQKLVAVTGVDAGTIRSRLRGEQFENKGVVKTGTTNPVSALAGMLSTKSGRRYFAIFNHRWAGLSSSPLRAFQNRVARKLMSDFGGGEAFDYTPKSIYPVDELMSEQ